MSGKITDEQRLKRIIDKFRTNIHSSKPVYESYQQMTTILNRYTTYKTYKQGCRIAVEGLKEFSIKNTDPTNKEIDLILQDLLTIFVNNVITKNCQVAEDYDFIKIEICKILKSLKIHNKPILHNSAIILNNFTIATSGFKFGDPLVHDLIGDLFYENEMFLEMERYYVLGNKDSYTKYIDFLWNYYVQNKSNGIKFEEVFSRVIFSYTFVENIKYAKEGSQELLKKYGESNSSVEKSKKHLSMNFFANDQYLNFLQLLLVVIQSKNVSFFNKIKAQYPEQTRVYGDYLTYIGEIYFNIKPQQAGGQGFNIMDMMKGFS